MKLEIITSAVLHQLTVSCTECGVTSAFIDTPSFACFSESPTSVTYRARLRGTSETDSGSLISLIEEWVSGGAGIIMTGVLVTVDSECPVAISSLGEGECQPPITDPITDSEVITPDPTSDPVTDSTTTTTDKTAANTDNTAAIIGGVVAVILIIALTIAAVTITFILKKNCGNVNKQKE